MASHKSQRKGSFLDADAVNQVKHEGLLRNLGASLFRDMVGFTLGALIGIVLGTVLGFSRIADRAFMPSFNGLRQIAILAWTSADLHLVRCG